MAIQEALTEYSGAGKPTTAVLNIIGVPSAIVEKGFRVATVDGLKFKTYFTTDYEITLTGEAVPVDITAEITGDRPAPADTITVVVDPRPEVFSVTNPLDAISGFDGGFDYYVDDIGEMVLVSNSDEVRLLLIQRLQFIRGEWPYNLTVGIPFFTDIFTRPVSKYRVDSIFKAEILNTPGVRALVNYKSILDLKGRLFSISFTYKDIYTSTENDVSLTLG